jgi:hypothetical protein
VHWQRCIITSCDSFRKDNVWHVFATSGHAGGDIAFVKGCHAELFELQIGVSWEDRGVRVDDHDAFGVELRVGVDSASQPVNKRKHMSEAPVVPEASVVPKRSAGQASSSNGDGSSTHPIIQAVRTIATNPPLDCKPAPISLKLDATMIPGPPRPPKAAPPVLKDDSAAQPVKDASQGTPKAAPPVAKVHLKASSKNTASHAVKKLERTTEEEDEPVLSRVMREEIQAHCKKDRRTAPSSPTEMPATTPDSADEDDADLPSSPTDEPVVLISRADAVYSPTDEPVVLISRADAVYQSIFEFWVNRENSEEVFQEQDQLRRLMFPKKKHAVPEDYWIPGAAPEGETQFVEAVVSNEYVLQQLKEVVMKREAWLTKHNLPMDYFMRNGLGLERGRFVKDCKLEYEAEPHQVYQQERDAQNPVYKKDRVRQGMHSRWGAEMQRRLGSKTLWELVSFTGQFSVEFLTPAAQAMNAGAPQPDVNVTNSQRLRAHALQCRADLRYATSLAFQRARGRKIFGAWEWQLLQDFDSDQLRMQSNDATKAHGHGRIKHANGTHTDIGSAIGGLTRTILDNWVPPVLSDADDDPVTDAADDGEAEPENKIPSPSSESDWEVGVIARANEVSTHRGN